ncbi:hypothetical protein E2C01_049805 [Portunus trituberculatus]|uniref:Uncharacterized protein n=1 Tax=Portunus trituberculatus TaxID=210409 RepID=A0A5B7G6K4_PORTR|nr:hypothetical protein [Portunus trituberculatus]
MVRRDRSGPVNAFVNCASNHLHSQARAVTTITPHSPPPLYQDGEDPDDLQEGAARGKGPRTVSPPLSVGRGRGCLGGQML